MTNRAMERPKHTLHQAMGIVLLEQPEFSASVELISNLVFNRELYWKEDGGQPTPRQIYLRASQYLDMFDISEDQKIIRVVIPMPITFLDEVYYRVDFDRELVFKFFTIFSLFEYALKQSGFLIGETGNDVKPDWITFAQSIETDFDIHQSPHLEYAVEYMLTNPVQKQVRTENHWEFRQRLRPPGISDAEWLSILIRGVRNNLFHGGKFQYERPRDFELIQYSMVILDNWATLHPTVRQALIEIQ